MNKNIFPYFFGVGIIVCILFASAHVILSKPTIVVNMPADAKPLAELEKHPTVNISEQRAVLWWTVFKYSAEKGYMQHAVAAANEAVRAVYGEQKGNTK